MEAAIAMLPTSVVVRKGYLLRLLLASSDAANFRGSAAYSAVIGGASRIELPTAVRGDVQEASTAATAAAKPAAGKPNFSGTWKLNLAASDYSDKHANVPDSLVRTVEQRGDSIKWSVERRKGGQKGTYQVSLKIGGAAYESNEAGVVTAQWEASVLVVKTLLNADTDRRVEQVEKWTLSEDGRRVTDAFSAQLSDGTEIRIRRVFDKQ
jgi:hypothetical protein